ncbi:hypothetical protein Tco_0544758 [Tanacetum coccineum]
MEKRGEVVVVSVDCDAAVVGDGLVEMRSVACGDGDEVAVILVLTHGGGEWRREGWATVVTNQGSAEIWPELKEQRRKSFCGGVCVTRVNKMRKTLHV